MPNRRDFLKVGGAFGLGAIAAGGVEYYLAQNEIADLNQKLKGSSSNLEPNLNFYNWYDYIEPNLVSDFQSENNVNLNLSLYGNPDEMEAKVKAGGSGVDLVIASD